MTAQVLIQQVLLKRGNTAVASAYTGPIGEVVVDTDLHTLRVQDAIEPGGFLVASEAFVTAQVGDITAGIPSLVGNLIANTVPASDRLTNDIHELVLHVGGAGPYVTFPAGNGVYIGVQGGEIAAIGNEVAILSAGDAVRLAANVAGDRKDWLFGTNGDLTFPDTTVQSTAYPGVLVPADGDTVSGNANMVFYAGTDWYNTSKVTINPTSSMLTINGNSGTGGITFPDATVQSTAWTNSIAYTDVTGTPTIPTSFSSLVNDTKTVSLGTDGYITLAHGTKLYDYGSSTGNGYGITDAVNGTYIGYDPTDTLGALHLDTYNGKNIRIRTTTLPSTYKDWLFGADGSLTLPTNGNISYTPANPSNWAGDPPTTIQEALDRIATILSALT